MPENEFPDIPKFLRIDADMQASLRKEQARLREKHGYDAQAVRVRGQAAQNQIIYEREIVLATQGLEYLQANDPGNEEAINKEKRRLAENLMRTGKVSEALVVAVDEQQIAQLTAIQAAIDIDDREKCKCEDDQIKGTGVIIPRHIETGQIMSDKHRALASIVVCSKCGHTNITPHVPKRPKLDALFPKGRPRLQDVVRTK